MTTLFELNNVTKRFLVGKRVVDALKGISTTIEAQSCHAVVGESGSGKSTMANILLGIYPQTSGELLYQGEAIPEKRDLAWKRKIQLVQQNPSSALNARRSIGASIRLALDVHDIGQKSERNDRVAQLLKEVGLEPDMARRVPGALSGGQKQRVAIARALACEPEVIVLDEPTSALDVLVQAQVLDLLKKLKAERGLTYVFITHDLAVVRNIADTVSVFCAGEIVEEGTTEAIFTNPKSEYTRNLISAIPVVTDEEVQLRNKLIHAKG